MLLTIKRTFEKPYLLMILFLLDVETNSSESKDSSSSSSGSNVGMIGGLIAALVFLVLVALLIVAYCVRRRKRGILVGENRSGIGEFQNPAYVGDPKLYLERPQSSRLQTPHEEPPPYLTEASPTGVTLDAEKTSLELNENVYEKPE